MFKINFYLFRNYKYILEFPKISDTFDDTNIYYKDLDNQLQYHLTIYKENNKTWKIINEDISLIGYISLKYY